jgi:hypothetical protein
MSNTEDGPQQPTPTAQPTEAIPPSQPGPATQPIPPAAPPLPPAAPPVEAQAPAATWPPAASPAPPARDRGAWIRALSPLTAGILSGLLLLAGFGVGVVVGWQHDGGDRVGPVGFSHGERHFRSGDGMRPDQRGFGYGPGFGAPGQPGQQGQQGQQGQRGQQGQQPNLPNRPNQPLTPSPSATS